MGATFVEQGTQMMVILRSIATAAARTVQFHGRPHRVVPAVLVRAQVLENNMGRTFLPEDEITEMWADAWNGIPVLVGPHPQRGGQPMSGRNPDLLEARQAGFVYHAAVDYGSDGVRRLTAEVWLDVERASVVPGFQDVLDAVDAGQPVELSTGFNTETDEISGAHNGQVYDMILHPQGADHLVISTEMTGACSVRDGCGLGINACGQCDRCAAGEVTMAEVATAEQEQAQNVPTQSVDGNPHPASHFAYVPDPQTPSTWKLPIFDANHTRNALARLNQTQIPAAAMAGVKRKLRAAARRFNIDATSLGNTAPKWLSRIAAFFGTGELETEMSYEDMVAANIARELALQQLTPLDDERRQMLKEALQAKYGDSSREVVVCDVQSEPERYVYFWLSTPMGPQPKGAEYLRAEWADADNDGIPEIVAGEPVLVRRMTQYAPVGPGPAGDGAPAGAAAAAYQTAAVDAKQEPAGAAAGAASEVKQGEPTALAAENTHAEDGAMAGSETKIEDVLAAVNALGAQVTKIAEKVTQMEADGTTIGGLKKSITELTQKVGNVEKLTAPAVEERERERRELVSSLAGNHKVPFSVAELESKPLAELRKLAEMAESADYSGKGGPRGVENEQRFASTVPYYEGKKDEKAKTE